MTRRDEPNTLEGLGVPRPIPHRGLKRDLTLDQQPSCLAVPWATALVSPDFIRLCLRHRVTVARVSCSCDPTLKTVLAEIASAPYTYSPALRKAGGKFSRVIDIPATRELDPPRSHRPSPAPSVCYSLSPTGAVEDHRAPLITLPYDKGYLSGLGLCQ